MSWVSLLFVICVCVGVVVFKRSQAGSANVVWRDAAGRLDLLFEKGGSIHDRKITGRRRGFTVTVDTYAKGGGRNNTLYSRIVVDGGGRIPGSVALRREGSWLAVKKFFTGEDLQIGDPDFDTMVHVQGRPLDVIPALNRKARQEVAHLVERGGMVSEGSVRYEERGLFTSVPQITALVDVLAAVAERITLPPSEIASALSFNVTQDPMPGVRHSNLELLVKHFARSEQANYAVQAGLRDADPAVRFLAAKHAGEDGADTLASVLDDPNASASMRAQALNRLVAAYGDTRLRATIERALVDPSSEVRVAAVRAVGVIADTSFFEQLVGLLGAADDATRAVIVDVLGRTGDARAEEVLIGMLTLSAVEIQVAAARSLGIVGTVRAVEPLLPFTKGLLADARMKDVARTAVASIQGRLSGAEVGGLSLTGELDAAGGLSLADAHEGDLCFALRVEEEAG